MDGNFFRKKQARILFGAAHGMGRGALNPLTALREASLKEADFFACQLVLTADKRLACRKESGAAGLTRPDGSRPFSAGALTLERARSVLKAPLPELGKVVETAFRLSLPLALLLPNHLTADKADWKPVLAGLARACAGDHTPLLLASEDDRFLAWLEGSPARPAPWAKGLVIGPSHDCNVAGLCRSCGADLCVLPKDQASDCRLCGLRESGQYTMVLGDVEPRDILRLSISGADGFMVSDPEPLAVLFRRGRD